MLCSGSHAQGHFGTACSLPYSIKSAQAKASRASLRARRMRRRFADKGGVVEACMAAVHVPGLLDWRVCAQFRGGNFIDGSVRPAGLL